METPLRAGFFVCPVGRMLPVDMAEIALGVDHVAHQLLELRGIGKAAVALAVPDQRIVDR